MASGLQTSRLRWSQPRSTAPFESAEQRLEAGHACIDPVRLRAQPLVKRADAGAGLGATIAYADSRGWTETPGGAVRAYICPANGTK